jgi:hypothetical protein
VAEIQNGPHSCFTFVGLDHPSLDCAISADDCLEGRRIPVQDSVGVFLEYPKQLLIRDHRVFDHFGKTRTEFSDRQRPERQDIRHDQPWLVERTHQVLSLWKVHTRLPPDAAIHLCQERGWEVHEGDPAKECGGNEAGEIADHPTAEGKDGGAPIQTGAHQFAAQVGGLIQGLAFFARGDGHHAHVVAGLTE